MFRSFVAFSVALALTLGAWGPATPANPAASAAPAAASQTPTRGGTLVFAIWQEPTTVASIYQNQTVAGVVGDVVVEGLLRTDTDGNYQPLLAKSVPTVTNGGVKISA